MFWYGPSIHPSERSFIKLWLGEYPLLFGSLILTMAEVSQTNLFSFFE